MMNLENIEKIKGKRKDSLWTLLMNFFAERGMRGIPLTDREMIQYTKKVTQEDPNLYKELDRHLQEFWLD